jgi:gliding motility-associated-like protein
MHLKDYSYIISLKFFCMKRNVYLFFLILFLHPLAIKAQLCTGTPGAPIFKETFGAGTGSGAALPAGNTTYTYTAGWPSDGQYTIANTSNPAPGNTHWMTGADHTGDPNGYMFVVNASYAPGEFFRHSVTGLCANTTYVFSAWIANVNDTATVTFCKQNDPPYVFSNVLFKIENPATGNVNSISTGNIAPGNTSIEWHEFGFTFATGAGQTVVDLVMVNNSPGGCGNDLVIDDISFRPCGPNTSVVVIPFKPFYCSGDSITLDATIGPGYNSPVYQWQFSSDGGTTWTDILGATAEDLKLNPVAAKQAGKYRLLLAENGNISLSKCRVITDVVTLKIIQSPPILASATPASICTGNKSTLVASGANTYLWSPSGEKTATILVSPSTNTTYTVIGTDTVTGCISKAIVPVTVNTTPTSPVVLGPDSICSGNTASLKAIAPGGVYKWYEVATGGTLIYTGDTYITPVLNASKTYYVEVQSVSLCASTSRTPVNVKVGTTPTNAVIAGPDSICSGNTATLTATAPGGTYNWYDVPTGGTPVFTGTIFQTPVLNSNKTYYVEVVSAVSCISNSRTPVTVIVHTTPTSPVVAATDTICGRTAATLTAIAPGGTYKWYETATGGTPVYTGNPFHTPVLNSTKTYYVEVESASKCTSTSRTLVTVPVSEVHAQFSATPEMGEAPLWVEFINTSKGTGTLSYFWDLGNKFTSTSKNVSYTYTSTGEGSTTYNVILIVTNDFGCADTAKATITIDPHSELIVPNIFTPNDDGINDLFTLKSTGLHSIQAQLFNRWGLQMYEWNSIHGGWDGRTSTGLQAPEGTYYYIIKAKGEGITGKNYEFKGSFTLLR